MAGVKAGCNGCHAPIAFLAGDVPPPLPSTNSRANESVSCEVCHTVTGFAGDTPHNFNWISEPGKTKYGPREGKNSPEHDLVKSEFLGTAEFCGTCHNEKSPYGVWVKSTHLEWKEGPYAKQGVKCHDCHMTYAQGKTAAMGNAYPDARQHLFHGAHDSGQGQGHDRAPHPSRHPRGRARRPGQVHRRPLQPEDRPQVPDRLGRGPDRLDARRGRGRQGQGLSSARRQEGLRRRGVHDRRRHPGLPGHGHRPRTIPTSRASSGTASRSATASSACPTSTPRAG